jgi:hypothetical protein
MWLQPAWSSLTIKGVLKKEKIYVLFLQETIKQSFSDQGLQSLEIGDRFHWSWSPAAAGRYRGMLPGVRDSSLEVWATDKGEFFPKCFHSSSGLEVYL